MTMKSGLGSTITASNIRLRNKTAALHTLASFDTIPEATREKLLRSTTVLLPSLPRTLSGVGDPRDPKNKQLIRQATSSELAKITKQQNKEAYKDEQCVDTLRIPVSELGVAAVRLYYVTDWRTPTLHYRYIDSDKWTQPPGQLFLKCDTEDAPDRPDVKLPPGHNLWYITLLKCPGIECVPNDMGKAWDNPPGGKNYEILDSGPYLLHNGAIKPILPIPLRPLMLLERSVDIDSVIICWNPPIDGDMALEGYHIYRDGKKIGTVVVSDDLNELLFKDTGLYGSTRYSYTVCAYNANLEEGPHCAELIVQTADPDRPGSVTTLSVCSISENSLRLRWQIPLNNGGGVIKGYRVLRNGLPINSFETNDESIDYIDDKLEKTTWYGYHVTAFFDINNLEEYNGPAVQCLDMTEDDIEQFQSKILQAYIPSKGESYLADPKFGFTKITMPAPRLFERNTHIILQAFNWSSACNRNCWYKVLASKVDTMRKMGVTMSWLPPPSQSVAAQGYMPSKLYDLNSAYGSEDQLRALIASLHENKISPMLDLVCNHRCGSKQDDFGQWTIFENPNWGPWAIVKNNRQGYHHVSDQNDSGAQSDCAPDINHNNPKVKDDIKKWVRWLYEDVGFNTVRIDMAPGYGTNHQLDYVQSMNMPLAVAEYWSGDCNALRHYCEKAQRKVAVFDFAFYYILRRSVENNNYEEMRCDGKVNGLIGRDPGLCVTFLDNHDTAHLAFVGKFAKGDIKKITRGYAVLFTHPGIPSVFWDHFSDYGELTNYLTCMGQVRHHAKVHSLSNIEIHRAEYNLYATITHGDHHRIALRLGHNDWHPGGGFEERFSEDGVKIWISR